LVVRETAGQEDDHREHDTEVQVVYAYGLDAVRHEAQNAGGPEQQREEAGLVLDEEKPPRRRGRRRQLVEVVLAANDL
jgi:hypothetical protein